MNNFHLCDIGSVGPKLRCEVSPVIHPAEDIFLIDGDDGSSGPWQKPWHNWSSADIDVGIEEPVTWFCRTRLLL